MEIRRLTPADAADYRAFMLAAYAEAPNAFISTVPEREPMPLEWWTARVSDDPEAPQLVLGAFVDARLAGVAGLKLERRPRTRHKASLYGMAVGRRFRGRGIARALVEAAVEAARATPGIRVVQLTVTEGNAPALRLYESCGFVAFGTEPLAIRDGERYLAIVHMWRDLGR